MRWLALVVAAALLWPAPARAASLPTVEELIGFFDSVALFAETTVVGDQPVVASAIERWEAPVRVYFDASIPGQLHERIWRRFTRAREVTGLDIARVFDIDDANLIVYFRTMAQIGRLAGSGETLCLEQGIEEHGRIVQAEIFIPSNRPVWLDQCVAHELLHALGLSAHPKEGMGRSALEDNAPASIGAFTSWDELALQILYDRRLKAGLARERALPLVRIIAAELTAGALSRVAPAGDR